MNTILVLALFVALASCFTEQEYQTAFTNWMQEQKKSYAATEFQTRFTIFKSNMDYVDQWNAAGSKTVLGLTAFADLTNEEYQKTFLGTRIEREPTVVVDTPAPADLPTSVDWRQEGAVTPIKNQGQCGSCWSFSTTGSVEGIHKISGGALTSLSEQNLMDCSSKYGDMGCNGGLMDDAFKYIIANKGVDTEESYPYEAKEGTCRFNAANVGATITGYTDVTSGSESALQSASVNQPISVAIDASKNSFQLYKSGVYYEPTCSPKKLDHGVLVIGYGMDGNDAYWLVKNSWGTTWGQQGYIWMSRNRNNNCGIATSASYPTASSELLAATSKKPTTTTTTHKPTTAIATATHTGTTATATSETSHQTSQSSHQTSQSSQSSQTSYTGGVGEAMYKPIGGKGFKPSKDQAAKFNF